MDWTTILPTIGISGATGLAAAWAGSKVFASKWLDHRFASKLETLKLEGQHQLELVRQQGLHDIERLKFQRANTLDRDTKLNQVEFQIIPEIWRTITASHSSILDLVQVLRMRFDLSQMGSAQFQEFISNSRLPDWRKNEITGLPTSERSKAYSDAAGRLRLKDAATDLHNMNLAINNNCIFLDPQTNDRFEQFAQRLGRVFSIFREWYDFNDLSLNELDTEDLIGDYRRNGTAEYDNLGAYLRERYWIKPDA